MLYLLFNQDRVFLGEITSRGGSLKHCFLSDAGEREVGSLVERWQTEGLPAGSEGRTVPPRSDDFAATLPLWVVDHGLLLVALPHSLIRHWECVAQAPVGEEMRYGLTLELTDQAPDISAWQERVESEHRKPSSASKSTQKSKKKVGASQKKKTK